MEQGDLVDAFITQQLAAWFVSSPFPPANCSSVINLTVMPKKTSGKWRIIVNLSRPCNASVNDCIRREFTQVAYLSVEDAALIMHTLGHNAQLAKMISGMLTAPFLLTPSTAFFSG